MQSFWWPKLLNAAMLAFAGNLVASAFAATAEPGPASCLPIHSETILAADLAAGNPVFAALDPRMPIGAAPMAGAQRVFRGVELARLVRQNHLGTGPLRDICFEWPSETIPRERLAETMARVLGYQAGAVEIVEQSRFPAPPGELVFAKEDLQPVPGSDGRVLLWKGFVRYCASRRFPIWARVRILAPVTRVVARSPLAPGEIIPENLLETVVIADGIVDGIYASSTAEVAGRVPRTRIEPGVSIRLSDTTSPPEIRAGDDVQVEVRNGPMRIRLVARAECSGRIGDTIPLMNPESSAHFRARVDSRDRAIVTVQSR